MKTLLRFIAFTALSAFAITVAARYVPGVSVSGLQPAVVATLLLVLVRYTIEPVLRIVSLPITLLTLGLFSFVLNGLILFVVAKLVDGFDITTILAGIIAAIVISLIKMVGSKVIDIIL